MCACVYVIYSIFCSTHHCYIALIGNANHFCSGRHFPGQTILIPIPHHPIMPPHWLKQPSFPGSVALCAFSPTERRLGQPMCMQSRLMEYFLCRPKKKPCCIQCKCKWSSVITCCVTAPLLDTARLSCPSITELLGKLCFFQNVFRSFILKTKSCFLW